MSALARGTSHLPAEVRRTKRADDWLINQLPVSMLSHDFFVRYVTHLPGARIDPLLEDADTVEHIADLVRGAPGRCFRWLGSWIGVESLLMPRCPRNCARRIVGSAASTLTWRGDHARVAGATWVDQRQ